MSVYDQPITSYDNTTLHPRVIGELIHLIDPVDTPVVAEFGLDSARSKFNISKNGKKIEWLEDEYAVTSTAANQGTTITDATTTISFSDASNLNVGMLLRADDEILHVTAISTNSVTVARGFGDSTATTHGATVTCQIVGYARLDGADATYGPVMEVTAPYNMTSIYEESVKVVGTELAMDHYGLADMFNYQVAKKAKELLRILNRQFYEPNTRAVGTSTTGRAFGGIGKFITDNTSGLTTTLTKAALDTVAKSIFDDGGMVDLLILGSGGWKTLRGLMDSSSFIRIGQENTVFGMRNIARANLFAFDNVRILVDRWAPAQRAYLVNSSKIGFYTLRPLSQYDIYRKGDYVAGELIGEYSLAVANDKSHGYVVTSAASL